jgi:hypothetical protein
MGGEEEMPAKEPPAEEPAGEMPAQELPPAPEEEPMKEWIMRMAGLKK